MHSSIALVLFVLVTTACGGSNDGGGGGAVPGSASGSIVKGILSGADITVFELLPTGALGDQVGTGATGVDGSFDVGVGSYRGWAVVCASGGSYVDEATGMTATIDPAFPLYGLALIEDTSADHVVTPLTTIAFFLAQTLSHDPNMGTDLAVQNALQAIGTYFGIPDASRTIPADPTAGPLVAGPEADYGLLNAAFAQLALTYAVDVMKLVHALANDLSDYLGDGLTFTETTVLEDIPVPAGTRDLPIAAATSDIATAFDDFIVSPQNLSTLVPADTLVDDVLTANTGDVNKPPRITAVKNSYGRTDVDVAATIRGSGLPTLSNAQVRIGAELVSVTSAAADEIGFDVPFTLALGKHELLLGDLSTGLFARIAEGIEVFDPFVQPVLTRGEPLSGPLQGGTFFTLQGNNFSPLTSVTFGGTPAALLASDYPRYTVWHVPPGVGFGPVNVQVSNAGNAINLQASFNYRAQEFRADASIPSPTGPTVFSAARFFFDMTTGINVEILDGMVDFTGLDFGDYSMYSRVQNESFPTTSLQTFGGTNMAFQSNESIGKSFLLDRGTGMTDFFRGWTNEGNHASAGTTAFGPAYFFPRASGVGSSNYAREYWLNGFEANLALGKISQRLGWVDLELDGSGSASIDFHARDFAGVDFEYGRQEWKIDLAVDFQGRMTGTRDEDGAVDVIEGWGNQDGSSVHWIIDGADGTLGFYNLIPIEYGLEIGGWGGWLGGLVAHELKDDGMSGMESQFEAGSYKGLIHYEQDGLSQRLAFNRTTKIDPNETGDFAETLDQEDFDVHPSGMMWDDGKIIGLLSSYDGLLMPTGEFPNECDRNAGLDLKMAAGLAIFRHTRQSFLGLGSSWGSLQMGTSFRPAETGETFAPQLGFTRFEDYTIDVNVGPTFGGDEFGLAATIPTLAATTPAGVYKTALRDGAGSVVSDLNFTPPQVSLDVGFTSVDDTFEIFASRTTDAGSPFAGRSFPIWLGSGNFSGDFQLGAFRVNDFTLGDALWLMMRDDGSTATEPTGSMGVMGLQFDPGTGMMTRVTGLNGHIDFLGGGSTDVDIDDLSKYEDGSFASDGLWGFGLVSRQGGQEFRLNIPPRMMGDPDQLIDAFAVPSQDFLVGHDVTVDDKIGLYLIVRPAITESFLSPHKLLIGFEPDPETTQTTTLQKIFTPGHGQINFTGENFISIRTSTTQRSWPGQSFAVTDPMQPAPGEGRIPFVGQLPVLGFFFSNRGRAAGQLELPIQLTPRLFAGLDF